MNGKALLNFFMALGLVKQILLFFHICPKKQASGVAELSIYYLLLFSPCCANMDQKGTYVKSACMIANNGTKDYMSLIKKGE